MTLLRLVSGVSYRCDADPVHLVGVKVFGRHFPRLVSMNVSHVEPLLRVLFRNN